ncbi:MAG: hypothetical protein IT238_00150 [Bacteroidia bacterium]|nr:hypothetical protein [Bacteroidia bacterium]MCZ2249651.1 hypothetical protein [Bacteroidia bacterium]
MKKIKLIWDFRGPDARGTAEHHAHHLTEFAEDNQVEKNLVGFEELSSMYSIAYFIVPEEKMIEYRDKLRPHRGEWYEPETENE